MIVGVGATTGDGGDHLVGVHVRRRSGSGLEHVDGELVVVVTMRQPRRQRVAIAAAMLGVEQPEIGVRPAPPPP